MNHVLTIPWNHVLTIPMCENSGHILRTESSEVQTKRAVREWTTENNAKNKSKCNSMLRHIFRILLIILSMLDVKFVLKKIVSLK